MKYNEKEHLKKMLTQRVCPGTALLLNQKDENVTKELTRLGHVTIWFASPGI